METCFLGRIWLGYLREHIFGASTVHVPGRVSIRPVVHNTYSCRGNSFDTEMPLEVDDEYWENDDPSLAFRQPPGKPSTMSYWICFLKLMHILGSVLRTFVSKFP